MNATPLLQDSTVGSEYLAPEPETVQLDICELTAHFAMDDEQPNEWLAAKPMPAPSGKSHEAQVLANRFVNLLRLVFRQDCREWMRLVKQKKPIAKNDSSCVPEWEWEMQREELVRMYLFGFLDGLRYFDQARKKADFQARFVDVVLREARQLPFQIAQRYDNRLIDWVLGRMRPARDYQQSRRYGVSTMQACDIYLRDNPEWRGGRRNLEVAMKAAISEAFAQERDVLFNHHTWYHDADKRFRRGRGFKGLLWISKTGDPVGDPFCDRREC